MLRSGGYETFMIDDPGLLVDPLAPAIGACFGEHDGAPLAGQRRPVERRLRQTTAAAGDLGQHQGQRVWAGVGAPCVCSMSTLLEPGSGVG